MSIDINKTILKCKTFLEYMITSISRNLQLKPTYTI